MLSNITSTLQNFKGDIAAPSIFDVTNSGELFAGFAVGGLGICSVCHTLQQIFESIATATGKAVFAVDGRSSVKMLACGDEQKCGVQWQ